MSGEIGSLPVYTITVGQSGTFTNDATVNIAPIVNAEIADAPTGDQIVVLFEPGTYGENTPILIGSNTSVIGDDSTLFHIGTIATSDNGALIANKDNYNLGGKYYVTNTDGTTVTLTSPNGTTNYLAYDPGTPIVDTNMLVEGMTFLSTGGNTFANQAYNNFGTWFSDAENVAVQNNTYIGGTDGNAFVNVVNGIVANNIAVGQTNAAYDAWNGPVNITIEDNTSFMGKGPSTGWSVLINSTPTGDAANPGNAVNDGIVDNQFASAYEYSAATNTDALLSYGITYEENITQQGNVDSVMDSPDGQGFFAANVDGSVMEDNVVTDPETTAGNSNNVVANRTSSDTQPAEATNGNVIGNLVFGGWASGGSAAITDQGGGTNTANNAVLGESGAPANAISNINYTGSDATTGSIQGSGTTLSGSGVTPELGITAPATLFAATATAVAVGGLAINDVNAADSLSVTLTTTFGTLSLTGGAAHVTYGTYGGQNGVLLTGTPAQIDAALAGLTYTGNAAGYDDAIEVNVSDPSGLSATRYIPVTVGDFGAGQDQVITIPAGELIPMETVASEFPGQTLPAAPNLGGEIVIAAAGDNLITMGSTVSMAFLGLGANTVQGGNTQEYIATESGPSTINLDQGGDVTVAGGAGPLDVNAATGDNLLELGSSDANISLGSGANSIVGGLGNATIQGGSGTACIATLPQDGGAMNISLGSGNATIYGLSGNDVIQTQMNTSNVIYAGIGNDSIMSGGSDAIFTGAGAATVNASGAGATSVFGGTGSLYFIGGAGVSTSYIDPANSTTIEAGSGDLNVGQIGTFVLEISLLDGTTRTISLPSLSGGVSLQGFSTAPIVTEYFASGTLDAVLSDGTQLAITDPTDNFLEVVNGNLSFTTTLLPTQTKIVEVGALPGIAGDDPAAFESIVNREITSIGSDYPIDLLISNGSYDINGYQDVVNGTQFISALSEGETITSRADSNNSYYADSGNDQIISSGDDLIFAGSGDTITASATASDTIYGGSGNLTFFAGAGPSLIDPSASTTIQAGNGDLTIGSTGSFTLEISSLGGTSRTITLPDLSDGVILDGYSSESIVSEVLRQTTLEATLSDGTSLDILDTAGLSLISQNGTLEFNGGTLDQGVFVINVDALTGISLDGEVDDSQAINSALSELPAGAAVNLIFAAGDYLLNGVQYIVSADPTMDALPAADSVSSAPGTSNTFYADLGSDYILSEGTDVLYAGSGDTVDASGGGSDTVYGGAGILTFIGGSGSSYINPAASTSIMVGSGDLAVGPGGAFNLSITYLEGKTRVITLPGLSNGIEVNGFGQDAIVSEVENNGTLNVTLSDGTLLEIVDTGSLAAVDQSGVIAFGTQSVPNSGIVVGSSDFFSETVGSGSILASGDDTIIAAGSSYNIEGASSGGDNIVNFSSVGGVTTEGGSNNVFVSGNSDTIVSNGSNDLIVSGANSATISVSGFADFIGLSGDETVSTIGTGSIVGLIGWGYAGKMCFINDSSSASTITGMGGQLTVFGGAGGGHYQGGALGSNLLEGGSGLVTLVGSTAGNDTLIAAGSSTTGINVIQASSMINSGGNQTLVSESTAGTTLFVLNAGLDNVSAAGSGTQYFILSNQGEATVAGTTDSNGNNQFFLTQTSAQGGNSDLIINFSIQKDNFSIVNSTGVSIAGAVDEQNLGGGATGCLVSLSNGTTIKLEGVNFTATQLASIVGSSSF